MPQGPEQPEPANLELQSVGHACCWVDVSKAPRRLAGSFAVTSSTEVADFSTSPRCIPGRDRSQGRWKGKGHGLEVGSWALDSSQCATKDWFQLPNLYHEKAALA